jgi:branched-chain amino acid transport system ATP-binding protein
MLRLEDLQVSRGRTPVLHGLTLELGAGEIAALVGANGAGKTTTLMALSGLLPIAAGRAVLEREGRTIDIGRSTPAALVAAGLIHCPEGRQVFARLTIEENLRLGAYLNREEAAVKRLLGEAYALFPVLGERRHLAAGGLSGGEQMMLAVARALMAEPRVLLLDEPSLGLAPQITERIFDTLAALNRDRGVAMLIVEQNAMLALEIAHKGFVMEEGRIVMADTGSALLEDSGVVQAYLGGAA